MDVISFIKSGKYIVFSVTHSYSLLQSGHNIEKVREKMRELLKQIVCIYSAPKLLPYILQGLSSKNSRTKIECVDLIGWLMDHNGTEVNLLITR